MVEHCQCFLVSIFARLIDKQTDSMIHQHEVAMRTRDEQNWEESNVRMIYSKNLMGHGQYLHVISFGT